MSKRTLSPRDYDDYGGPMCNRCLEIPRLLHSEKHGDLTLFRVEEPVKELEASNCRICRLLGLGLSKHGLDTTNSYMQIVGLGSHGPSLCIAYGDGSRFEVLQVLHSVFYRSPDLSMGECCLAEHVDFEVIKSWIHECKVSHDRCSSNLELEKSPTNLKVINCLRRIIISAPTDCHFVALSYVWGQSKPIEDTMLSDRLPRTIEDSIKVSLLLGYCFLWIDRFCIDQDSKDKHTQIHQMGAIYASAQITLVAAAGKDPNYGLPGVSKRPSRSREELGSNAAICCKRTGVIDVLNASVWASRAWSFQEGYISRRRLCFTEHEIVLFCNTATYPDVVITRPTYLGENTTIPTHVYEPPPVLQLLEKYTSRSQSYDSDALNAIVGVLNTLSSEDVPVAHIWGVPFYGTSSFAMNWSHPRPTSRRPGFPIWSPLGWKDSVSFEIRPAPPNLPRKASMPKSLYTSNKISFKPVSGGVKAWMGDEFKPLPPLASGTWNPDMFLTPKSQCLEITALTTPLDWVDVVLDERLPFTNASSGPHLVLPSYNGSYDLYVPTCLDDDSYNHNENSSAVCAFVGDLSADKPFVRCSNSSTGFMSV